MTDFERGYQDMDRKILLEILTNGPGSNLFKFLTNETSRLRSEIRPEGPYLEGAGKRLKELSTLLWLRL